MNFKYIYIEKTVSLVCKCIRCVFLILCFMPPVILGCHWWFTDYQLAAPLVSHQKVFADSGPPMGHQ